MEAATLKDQAERALDRLRAAGFDAAQVTAAAAGKNEINIEDNEPALFRTTAKGRLSLVGIVDGRKAATDLTDLREASVQAAVDTLRKVAAAAPRDDANRVSSGERAAIAQGPREADVALLSDKAAELLAFFSGEVPKVRVRQGIACHNRVVAHMLTSGGSQFDIDLGHYSLMAFGAARDGDKVSSFQVAAGDCHALDGPAVGYFGIADTFRQLERQVHSKPFGERFQGDVVLAPSAVADLMAWLLGQVGDDALISGTSVYRERVGSAVASPLLSIRSRFDAPGVCAVSADAFAARPVTLIEGGVLRTLLPSLYGSLKTGLPHVPVAAGGWEVAAGEVPREEVIGGVERGALVGRLSMGRPTASGDFAGVIKNSFAIRNGMVGHALTETMISGNVADMLRDIRSLSAERLDTGALLLPWVRVAGLHFS